MMRGTLAWFPNQADPSGGGYASLVGPGQTSTPGALTQSGNFTVLDDSGNTVLQIPNVGGSFSIGDTDVGVASALSFFFSVFFNMTMQAKNELSLEAGSSAESSIGLSGGGRIGLSGSTEIDIDAPSIFTAGATAMAGHGGATVIRIGTNLLGFFNVSPVGQQPAPSTLADVITALHNLGLTA